MAPTSPVQLREYTDGLQAKHGGRGHRQISSVCCLTGMFTVGGSSVGEEESALCWALMQRSSPPPSTTPAWSAEEPSSTWLMTSLTRPRWPRVPPAALEKCVAPLQTCKQEKRRRKQSKAECWTVGHNRCVCASGLSGPEVHGRVGVWGGRLSQQVSPSRGE